MSELVCIAYPDQEGAANVLSRLRQLEHEHLVDLDDAVIVTKDNDGEIELLQTTPHAGSGAAGVTAGAVAFLVSSIFLTPLAGLALGAGAGIVASRFDDFGVDDDFVEEAGRQLNPSSSALFILVRRSSPERVLPELGRYGGTVLRTTLAPDAAAQLQRALEATSASVVDIGPHAIPVHAQVRPIDEKSAVRSRSVVDPVTGHTTHICVTDQSQLAYARERLGVALASAMHVLPVTVPVNPDGGAGATATEEDLVHCVGARTESTDGLLGHVDAVLLDTANAGVSHLVVRQGHRVGARVIPIPIASIDQIQDNIVYLKLDNEAVDELIMIPVRQWLD